MKRGLRQIGMLILLMLVMSPISAMADYVIRNNGVYGITIDISKAPYTNSDWTVSAFGPTSCTWFAAARIKELTGINDKGVVYGGEKWYTSHYKDFSGFSAGRNFNANVKSLLCWSGHVAIYEGVTPDGKLIVSEGGVVDYPENGYCHIRTFNSVAEMEAKNGINNFYGYVYLPVAALNAKTNSLPYGAVDECTSNGDGTIHLRGWAFDPDTWSQSTRLELDVYIGADGYHGGKRYVTYTNGTERPDIHNGHGVGYNHGFELDLAVNERGNQPIYVYAIDSSDLNKNTLIHSGTVNIQLKTPTAISMDKSVTATEVGKSCYLYAIYSPSDTHNNYRGVTWSSSDETVATVDNGTIKGISEGTAVITATSTYNPNLKATCTVHVNNGIPKPTIRSITVDDNYVVHVEWEPSPLIDEEDVRTYTFELGLASGTSPNCYVRGLTETHYEYQFGPRNRDCYVGVTAVNQTTGQSSYAGKIFRVDWILKPEWQVASYIPENFTEEYCDIEYQSTYRVTSSTSPGTGWTLVSGTSDTWTRTGSWTTYPGSLPTEANRYSVQYRFRLKDTGHKLITVEKVEPTCTEEGTEAYWQCEDCGKLFSNAYATAEITSPVRIAALGHALVHHDAKAATCTEDGWDAYDTCERCDYTTYQIKKALGHNWGAAVYTWAEDHSSVTAARVCANDASHTETETIAATRTISSPTNRSAGSVTFVSGQFVNQAFTRQSQSTVIPALNTLKVLALPTGTQRIEKNAFAGAAFNAAIVPNSCEYIGEGAFSGCGKLVYIRVPASAEIEPDAFEGCGEAVIDKK